MPLWHNSYDLVFRILVKLRRRTPQQSWRGMQGAAAKLFKFEQIQLFIPFFFFLGTLLLNVISNDFSSYAVTHCTDIATITPKLATPEFFLDLWKSFEHLFSCNALYDLHNS